VAALPAGYMLVTLFCKTFRYTIRWRIFDFGDDWWHRIRVQSIRTGGFTKKSIKVIKSVGKSPEQYPDYDDYENEDYD